MLRFSDAERPNSCPADGGARQADEGSTGALTLERHRDNSVRILLHRVYSVLLAGVYYAQDAFGGGEPFMHQVSYTQRITSPI
jgi:hypothetical protein